jgi:hypothetical protein
LKNNSSADSKTDVLDLIINFLMEHEKQMDHLIRRLETLLEELTKNGSINRSRSDHTENAQTPAFKFTISNPDNFKEKSLEIEWGENR